MPRKVISGAEKRTILEMAEQGHSDAEIATALGWDKNRNNPARAVATQRRRLLREKGVTASPTSKATSASDSGILMEQMNRNERNSYLMSRLRRTPRYRMTVGQFSGDEQNLFCFEYEQVTQGIDSLTEAEEQMLFSALIEFVLAWRAQNTKTEEEKCVAETREQRWKQGDPRYRVTVDKQWSESYETHMKRYESLMKNLKTTRAQRLDKVKSEKRTLVDVALELTTGEQQTQAADEIETLDRAADAEIKRLLENGYLYGLFDVQVQQDTSNETEDVEEETGTE